MTTNVDTNASSSSTNQQGAGTNTHPLGFYFHALHWLDIVLATTFIFLVFLTDFHYRLPPASLAMTLSLLVLWLARGILAQTTHFGVCLSFVTSLLFGILYCGIAIVLYVNRPPLWPVLLAIAAASFEFRRYKIVHQHWIVMQKETKAPSEAVLETPPEENV